MRAFKCIALGLLFSFLLTIVYVLHGILTAGLPGLRGSETAHAVGLSAVLGGLIEATVEATVNPFFWLLIIASFGLGFWVTKPGTKQTLHQPNGGKA
ncbi:MAG TPA: hypothetical protein VIW23_00240 [Candidatus Acidoferrum sp.]|jgi:hypothetical protein